MVANKSHITIGFLLVALLSSGRLSACVSPELIDAADVDERESLSSLDAQCRRGFNALRRGQYLGALGVLEPLLGRADAIDWPIELAVAEALFGAGVPVERALEAWEGVVEPSTLVSSRLRELVERLDAGRAKALLQLDSTRAAAAWLRTRQGADSADRQVANSDVDSTLSRQKIAILLPLSGRLAVVGKALLDGMRFRLDDSVQLIIRDVGTMSGARLQETMTELAGSGISAIIGPVEGQRAEVASRVAAQLNIALLSLSPQHVEGATTFRGFVSRVSHCVALLRRVRRVGAKRYALIGADTAYGRALSSAFATAVEQVGGRLVTAVEYTAGRLDLARPAKALAKHRFDALFIADDPERASTILRYVARAGILTRAGGTIGMRDGLQYVQLLAPAEWLGKRIESADAKYLSGTWMATEWSGARAPEVQPLVADMKDHIQSKPSLFHAVGYDALGLIQQTKAESAAGVVKRLRSTVFAGILGRTRFGVTGDVLRDLRLYRIAERGYKRIGTAKFSKKAVK